MGDAFTGDAFTDKKKRVTYNKSNLSYVQNVYSKHHNFATRYAKLDEKFCINA